MVLELQPAQEPGLEPEDGGKEPAQGQPCSLDAAQPKGQHQAAWKEGSPGSPATAQEPGGGQSHQVEQPSAGSQVRSWQHGPGLPLPSSLGAGSPAGEGSRVVGGKAGGRVCSPQLTALPLSVPAARCWGAWSGARANQKVWGGISG